MALNDWMSQLDEKKTLGDIVMPGSHDACMYVCKTGTGSGVARRTITQFHSIGQQLADGTRFFDLRVYADGGTLRSGHFSTKNSATLGAFGPALSDVLLDIRNFAANNPSEVFVIKFSLAKDAGAAAIRAINTYLGHVLFSAPMKRNLATVRLEEFRQHGRVVAIFDKPVGDRVKMHLANKDTPEITLDKDSKKLLETTDRSLLWLNGNAPTANTITAVLEKQNEKRTGSKSRLTLMPHLEMFYLTITASKPNALIEAWSNVEKITSEQIGLTGVARDGGAQTQSRYASWSDGAEKYGAKIGQVAGDRKVNIFMYDFVNDEVNQLIIDRNNLS